MRQMVGGEKRSGKVIVTATYNVNINTQINRNF